MSETATGPKALDYDQAMIALGCKRRKLEGAVKKKEIRSWKTGAKRYFKPEDVEAYRLGHANNAKNQDGVPPQMENKFMQFEQKLRALESEVEKLKGERIAA